ncbi:hypothetical protein [Pontibacter chitinilyticus]|uniref:hypothetical protein n=1 Tax=Pontibacter chitinilyticus TaxID=2674989 RepID=UPI003219DA18
MESLQSLGGAPWRVPVPVGQRASAGSRHRAMPFSGAPAPPGRALAGLERTKNMKQDKYKTEEERQLTSIACLLKV